MLGLTWIFNKDNNETGSPLAELRQVIPQYTEKQIQHLLRELKLDKKNLLKGFGPSSRWYSDDN